MIVALVFIIFFISNSNLPTESLVIEGLSVQTSIFSLRFMRVFAVKSDFSEVNMRITFILLVIFQDEHVLDWSSLALLDHPDII